MQRLQISLCMLMLVSSAANAFAAVVTTPAELFPGDKYRLVFVTSSSTQAIATNIAFYNAFVSDAALRSDELSALQTSWKAIGSTLDVDARDNTGTSPAVSSGVPIYRLDGYRVASNNDDFWDGSLAAPVSIDELGTLETDGGVFTGTLLTGLVDLGSELGSLDAVRYGQLDESSRRWTNFARTSPEFEFPLYGISGILSVPPIPEPSSAALVGLSVVVTCGFRSRSNS